MRFIRGDYMKRRLLRWLRKHSIIRSANDKYTSFSELSKYEKPSSFSIDMEDRGSSITIMAIHGGRIEPGTSRLVKRLAGSRFNYYCFNAHKPRNNWDLHITSDRFDEPQALALAAKSKMVVTLHGCMGLGTVAYTGGGIASKQREKIESQLQAVGIKSRPHRIFNGRSSANICNHGRQPGLQFELTPSFRLSVFSFFKRRRFVKELGSALQEMA